MNNNQENQELLKDKVVPCCWSEVDEKGKHITQCPNTETTLDKDNHQIRFFCVEHLKKVEQIRYEMYLKLKEKYEGNSMAETTKTNIITSQLQKNESFQKHKAIIDSYHEEIKYLRVKRDSLDIKHKEDMDKWALLQQHISQLHYNLNNVVESMNKLLIN